MNFTGFEQLIEVPQILANRLRRLATEKGSDDGSHLPCGCA